MKIDTKLFVSHIGNPRDSFRELVSGIRWIFFDVLPGALSLCSTSLIKSKRPEVGVDDLGTLGNKNDFHVQDIRRKVRRKKKRKLYIMNRNDNWKQHKHNFGPKHLNSF